MLVEANRYICRDDRRCRTDGEWNGRTVPWSTSTWS